MSGDDVFANTAFVIILRTAKDLKRATPQRFIHTAGNEMIRLC